MNYFKTTGFVETLYREDGTVKGYRVFHTEGSVHVTNVIDEYYYKDNLVHIDKWGRPWVKH